MYNVHVKYHFKNEQMYSLFQSAVLYVVEGGQLGLDKNLKGFSKTKRKAITFFINQFISDFKYLIDKGYAKYDLEPLDVGGKCNLYIEFPGSEIETYKTYVEFKKKLILNAAIAPLRKFVEVKIIL